MHSKSHDIVAVLSRDEIGGLEEDASTLGEGSSSPRLACGQSSVNSSLDIGLGSVGVGSKRSMGGRVALSEGFRGVNLLAGNNEGEVQWSLLLVGGQSILEALTIWGTRDIMFLSIQSVSATATSRMAQSYSHWARC